MRTSVQESWELAPFFLGRKGRLGGPDGNTPANASPKSPNGPRRQNRTFLTMWLPDAFHLSSGNIGNPQVVKMEPPGLPNHWFPSPASHQFTGYQRGRGRGEALIGQGDWNVPGKTFFLQNMKKQEKPSGEASGKPSGTFREASGTQCLSK